ncbi:MAG: hypothetical protein ACRCVW_00665 [Brevinema sp.]
MRKLSLLGAFLVLTANIFAQEDSSSIDTLSVRQKKDVNRYLTFYLDSLSGQLNTSSTGGKLFQDNEFEFGALYSQNFTSVPWLSMWTKALVVTVVPTIYGPNGNTDWRGTEGIRLADYGHPRVQFGLNFNNNFFLAVDTRGLLATDLQYTLKFGGSQGLTFQAITEFFFIPLAGTQIGGKYEVLDLFELRLTYAARFAQKWTYLSKLGFRFNDESSATAFGDSFHLRWENQLAWNVTSAFLTWGQIRYEFDYNNGFGAKQHNVYLQAGVAYTFDFSGLSKK